ncbi:MAG: pilus assembly protein [Nitrosomonadales bacterium]|jgi:Flp pilus assembly protein TadG|nr:MAG: pilus assembly protein [Nitrosomonadales bacterium]
MKSIGYIVLRKSQQGAAAVEFSIIAVILFTLLFGVMEMGRMLFMMNATAEATRLGARLSVVCDMNADAAIKSKMINLAGYLTPSDINIVFVDSNGNSCTTNTCRYVTVSVNPIPIRSIVPFVPVNFPMPPFSTTLPRESMSSLNNPICV